jgi:hypothetical protein
MNETLPRNLPADRFHGGVRAAALFMWLAAIVVVFIVLRLVVGLFIADLGGAGVLVLVVLAVVLAQPLAFLGEKWLVTRWPSGRALRLEPNKLVWQERAGAQTFDLTTTLNYWRWRFVVKRRRGGRIPVGHQLFALRLVQGDEEFSVYTFLAPTAAQAAAERYSFYELRRPSDAAQATLGGRDAIFLAAEDARWQGGAELDPADFEALLQHLAARAPDFSQSAAGALNS